MPGVLSDKRPTPCGDEPAAHGQQKLGKQTLGVVAKAAAAALLPYLASYIPTMGPYLSIPLSLPLWLPLSMGLGMLAFVGLYVCARMQTQIARAPSPYPFDYLDFTWEIMPGFFSISRKIDRPSAQTLHDLIQGPFCPHCHGLLQQGVPVDLVFSLHTNEAYILEARRAGAAGYIGKDASAAELFRAVREVAAGRDYYPIQASAATAQYSLTPMTMIKGRNSGPAQQG
jgi:hypothetical protein